MSEIVISELQKAVVAKGALPSGKMDQILGRDFPALVQVAVWEWAKGLTERKDEGSVLAFG